MDGGNGFKGAHRWATDSRITLVLIAVYGFLIRIFSTVKYEVMLHEYDSHFNYNCAQYMVKHGIRQFLDYFDTGSWYPIGRHVGRSVYPGIMLLAYVIHTLLQYIGVDADLKTICVFIPPAFSIVTVYAVYLLAWEISNYDPAALASAFFISAMPAMLSRTAAGFYDYESIAIPLVVFVWYTWLRAVRTQILLLSVASAVVTFLLALSWGGYIFVLNMIACFTLAAMVFRLEAESASIVYVVYYVISLTLCFSVPVISYSVLGSLEMTLPHLVFAVTLITIWCCHIRNKDIGVDGITLMHQRKPQNNHASTRQVRYGSLLYQMIHRVLGFGLVLAPFVAVVWLLMIRKLTTSKTTLTGRLLSVINPYVAKESNPLVASIAEHQPTKWVNLVTDFWITLVYNPIGLYVCLVRNMDIGYIALVIYGLIAAYLTSAMVRLGVLFAPAAAMLSGLGLSYTLYSCARSKKRGIPVVTSVAITAIFMMGCITHGTWMASNIYSRPSIVTSWHSPKHGKIVQDDFRDAYTWIKYNTPPESVVMAWWDYGYQLRQMANRSVLTDNNTSNNQQIAITGLIFASEERDAYKMLKLLNVDYVMVVYGGIAKHEMDDMVKFMWMSKIAATEFPQVHDARFSKKEGRQRWQRTLLYKLCKHGLEELEGGRKEGSNASTISLEYFCEVFSSSNRLVRIYRVNDHIGSESTH
ncbi:oligosaccharyl transferase STT3 [Babesia ovis]|uniref:dolichyl-diphosphooligosaccharide--protein glycotransferase n=1 Tax=Babesia ovis TaxID=5869 RepID=A0A9W5TF26_BABOV|nr:oligosaccharyl transferase STT3 [Babesia ovis]